MAVWMTGVDHKKADLDIRSRFSFTSKQISEAYDSILQVPYVGGCLIIATCNRTELWIHTIGHKDISPARLLCDYLEIPFDDCKEYMVERKSKDAIDHLFRLAAGLESKIIGEGQILTQVGDALAFARSCFASDNTLEVLFRQAVTAGKRVRTETDLSTADRSVIHAALDIMKAKGFDPQGKKCLVIGNGMMGRLSAVVLMDRGASVTMTVRKYHKGVVEIPDGCDVAGFDERYDLLPDQDLVVSATSSPNYTLTREVLDRLSVDHDISILDLAVPRDVEKEADQIPWASVYDIDSFNIDMQSDKFRINLDKAKQIIEEVKADFYDWKDGRDLMPVIDTLKKKYGNDVVLRMTPFFKKLPIEQQEKNTLANEISGAVERSVNHLLFTVKSHMSDDAFTEMLDAMNAVIKNEKKEKGK